MNHLPRATFLHALRATCITGLLAALQAHATTTTDPDLSSGLGTLMRYLFPFWF